MSRRLIHWFIPLFCACFGTFVSFHETVCSGLDMVPGDPGDTRFNEFLLEHSWQWLWQRNPMHADFWSPGFYYPAQNLAAYSDLMIGYAPPYWMARLVGFSADQSSALWFLAMSVLNYLMAYLLLHRGLGFTGRASLVGAWVMAFGLSRLQQIGHQQLFPFLYVGGALVCIACYFRSDLSRPAGRERSWILLSGLSVAAQFYGGFYMGFFLVVALALMLLSALLMSDTRACLMAACRRDGWIMLGSLGLTALVLYPLASHYLETARLVGNRPWASVVGSLPRLSSWLLPGQTSFFYAWVVDMPIYNQLPDKHEQMIGLGIVSLLLSGWGLWSERRRPLARLTLLTSLFIVLIATQFPGGFSLWRCAFDLMPGAAAIRTVCRIGMLLLVPAAIGLALLSDHLRRRAAFGPETAEIVLLLGLVCCAEQLSQLMVYNAPAEHRAVENLVEHARRRQPACFLAVAPEGERCVAQIDAMLAASELGIPTLNGYSGNSPPGYQLYLKRPESQDEGDRNRSRIDSWVGMHQLDPETLALIELPMNYRGRPAAAHAAYAVDFIDVQVPAEVWQHEVYSIPVVVRNAGSMCWTTSGRQPFRVGLRVFAHTGGIACHEERCELSQVVLHGEIVSGRITLPVRDLPPGTYRVVVDMVSEHQFWFQDLGSNPYTTEITVRPPRSPAG